MGNSSKRKKFDALVSRILFFELGLLSIAVSSLVFINNPLTETLTILLFVGFFIVGTSCIFCCFAIDDKRIIKWAENTGNYWLLFLLVLIAYGSATAIRGKK